MKMRSLIDYTFIHCWWECILTHLFGGQFGGGLLVFLMHMWYIGNFPPKKIYMNVEIYG